MIGSVGLMKLAQPTSWLLPYRNSDCSIFLYEAKEFAGNSEAKREEEMKRINSSLYVYGGLVLFAVHPLAGAAAALPLYKLFISRRAEESREREKKIQQQREEFRVKFYARQNYSTYDAYLQSKAWLRKRSLVIERARGICESPSCTQNAAEVHHRWYPKTWGQESIDSLIALCHEHHMAEHE